MRSVTIAVLLSGLVGCADTGVTQEDPADTTVDVSMDSAAPSDIAEPDTDEPDMNVEDAGLPSTCEPGEGCFGEPCETADDCLSGICTMHLGDKVCSKTCDAECPVGWDCTLVGSGGDGQYVCMSKFSHLCLPCETSEGCAGDTPNACVKYADGTSFCGGACDLDTPCPSGYSCQETETANGATSYQCVNTAGVCPCSNLAIESALSTLCESTNDIGSCQGQRLCTEDGLTECSATEPSEEVCNGIDDNCNGLDDEGTCDDGNDCTIDTCAGTDGCVYEPLSEGECLDGDACTIADHCEEGVCVGTPVECDDDNPCTEDTCDGLGGCAFSNVVALCDDGDPCTLGDLCQEGICSGSANLTCDDGNSCTDDSCGADGCIFEPNEQACDDGNACTTDDACNVSTCLGTQVDCDDGNLCTTDSCDIAIGCLAANNEQPCDDADVCTQGDICTDGACSPGTASECDDGNPCTDDSCDSAAGCQFIANEQSCDDNNACTSLSMCKSGACVGEAAVDCDDNNLCTTDSCDPAMGCENVNNTSPCTDDDPCTVGDACADGACEAGNALPCDDGNPCTDDSCDVGVGCVFTPNAESCDDGNACTSESLCQSGVCQAVKQLSCDDGNPCTNDECDVQLGCVSSANALPCDDGDICTQGDACVDGDCEAGDGTLSCDDGNPCTSGGCDSEVGCIQTALDIPCDDGNVCTVGDACTGGTCASGGDSPDCNDGNDCTVGSCDPAKGCVQAALDGECDDSNACTVGDTCADGQCSPGPEPLPCDDENPCTLEECTPAGGCEQTSILEDNTPCGAGATCQNGECVSLKEGQNCLDIKLQNPAALSGTYSIDPDGEGGADAFDVYCDMTKDGGGWTLVFRDTMDGAMKEQHPGAISPNALATLEGATAKLADTLINSIRSETANAIAYRLDSPNVASAYFVPGACTYNHNSNITDECMRYRTAYAGGDALSYTQCINWGGGAGGINIWYACGGTSGYTNVVKTHSDPSRGMACITNNPQGNSKGAAGGVVQSGAPIGCGYEKPLLMWVR